MRAPAASLLAEPFWFPEECAKRLHDAVKDLSHVQAPSRGGRGRAQANNGKSARRVRKESKTDAEILEQFLAQEKRRKKMLAQRKRLPAFKIRDKIAKMVQENQVIVVSGETGCGKTTQVAQILLEDEILQGRGSTCNIICTQPRRICAIGVAERVAEEMGDNGVGSPGRIPGPQRASSMRKHEALFARPGFCCAAAE